MTTRGPAGTYSPATFPPLDAPAARRAAGNALTFASDLADFRSEVAWLRQYEDRAQEPYGPVLAALEVLLQALEAGHGRVGSISLALSTWRKAEKRRRDAEERGRARGEAAAARRAAEEEITRQVECPYCGSQPGASCRTAGEARHPLTASHRGRYRLARSLNDGDRDADARPVGTDDGR